MAAFFVTGSGTDIGKTFVCAGLAAYWRDAGLKPAVFKPVVTGFDLEAPEGSDPAMLLAALGLPTDRAALQAIAPFRFRAPLSPDQAAALEGRSLGLEDVAKACRAAIQAADGPILVEGAGGVMSPLNGRATMLDLAAAIAVPVLFVADSRLGSISHALTGLAALKARALPVAVLLVNESPSGSVGTAPTMSSIAGHFDEAPILAVPRGAGRQTWAQISDALGVG
ncbi:MAG TPA: dethiobiotin synthase [Caulobacteraceae bacterium]|nr:dethiobiotin synthase [Caulobacteraceae bacterium]